MQDNKIRKIKLELKVLRRRQDLHNFNKKMATRKSKLTSILWKLLKEQSRLERPSKSSRPARARQESEISRKTKRSGQYI